MDVLSLSPAAVHHAIRRHQAYGNSPARIASHYRRRGEHARERICRMVHALERRHAIDLGALCSRFETRGEPHVPPFERAVLELLAEWVEPRGEMPALIVHVDRVRALNALAVEGELAEARRQAACLARALARRSDPV